MILVEEIGTGKPFSKTIARMLDVPFCIADATVLTEAGALERTKAFFKLLQIRL